MTLICMILRPRSIALPGLVGACPAEDSLTALAA
jgi:hypothetical protein